MDLKLTDRVAIITGPAKGMGAAITRAFAAEGAAVAVHGTRFDSPKTFGEGESMGPLSPAMKKELVELETDIKYPVEWTTLREYLDWLAGRGVTPTVP